MAVAAADVEVAKDLETTLSITRPVFLKIAVGFCVWGAGRTHRSTGPGPSDRKTQSNKPRQNPRFTRSWVSKQSGVPPNILGTPCILVPCGVRFYSAFCGFLLSHKRTRQCRPLSTPLPRPAWPSVWARVLSPPSARRLLAPSIARGYVFCLPLVF